MPRPILATIHLGALRHNLHQIQQASPHVKIWAVVKANAYGHGIENVFDALKSADGFALLELVEAQRIRALGWRGPILLLQGAFAPRDLELCSRLNLWHVVHCEAQIDALAAHKTQIPHRVFLKMNTGMNRLGFSPLAYRAAWTRLSALPQVDEISHMTHFANADAPGGIDTQKASRIFSITTDGLDGECSLHNSAAIFGSIHTQHTCSDWVRSGIALYGSAPNFPHQNIVDLNLQPTLTLSSRIIAIQHLNIGDAVGYGGTFVAPKAMQIGVVACGYADGYPRHCTTGTPILVNGIRTQTAGRVSMDMLMVDLSAAPLRHVGIGAEVTLWGKASTGQTLSMDEIADAAGTIAYELMCALAPRVPVVVDVDG